MTLKEFMKNNNIKSEKIVKKWIKNNWIPGVKTNSQTNEFVIPDSARPPYTERRANTSKAIYKSIVKACIKRKHVCASLYNIEEIEFNHYITELENSGFIESKVIDDITYYYATIKSDDFVKSKNHIELIQTCLKTAIESAAKGVTSAVLDKVI